MGDWFRPHLRLLRTPGSFDGATAITPVEAPAEVTCGGLRETQAAERRAVGTLYGRIFLDICKSHHDDWHFCRTEAITSFLHSFRQRDCLVAYAFATGGPDSDLGTLAETAIRGVRPGAYPRIMKLYAQGDSNGATSLRAHMRQIAGKSYFILPSHEEHRERIWLGADYQGFLARLGRHSRRNIRLVRRQAAQGGIRHAMIWRDECPPKAMQDLVGRTYPTPFDDRTVAAIYRLIGQHGNGFHSVLASPCGTFISCCSGFTAGKVAFVVHQMNHRDHLQNNPSLTNRAFLIEELIGTGIENLVFVRGCKGILHFACEPEIGTTIWIIRRSFGSLICAALLLGRFPLSDLPAKLRAFLAHVGWRRDKPGGLAENTRRL